MLFSQLNKRHVDTYYNSTLHLIIHALKSSCSLDWQAISKKGLAIGAWAKELVCVRLLKKQFLSKIYG